MTILISPDKFKGSLSAKEVCQAVSRGLLQISPAVAIESVPLADGGEGTCDLLTECAGGMRIEMEVHGPLFTPVPAGYGISKERNTAFIEMAVASGLTLLRAEDRNPLLTTTLGTGEMIADALDKGVKKIVLGLGGSATIDAGTGMATALGYKFCDADGEPLEPTGENLIHIRSLDTHSVHPSLKEVEFLALCDVTNPLFGHRGAAYVYGPQKGGNRRTLELLDAGLRNFRRMVHKYLKMSVDFPGAGAAGGLGAGAKVFLHARIVRGIDYIIESTGLPEKILHADLVITGEGNIDDQTFSGKVVSEVIRLAATAGKPVVAICGKSDIPEKEVQSYGVKKLISLIDHETSAEVAMEQAAALITRKISQECKELVET